MKTNLLLLFGSILLSLLSTAQNPTWILAPNYTTNSGSSQPLPTGPSDEPWVNYTGLPAHYGSGGISNLDGELKFFIVDGMIYDNDGAYITYAWSTGYPNIFYETIDDSLIKWHVNGNGSDLLIIPHPVDCEKFYLIGSVELIGSIQTSRPYYALFDYSTKQIIRRGEWYGNDFSPSWEIPIFNIYTNINDPAISGGLWGDMIHGRGQISYAVTEPYPDGSRYILGSMGTHILILKLGSNGELNYHRRYSLPAAGVYGGNRSRSETEVFIDHVNERVVVATVKRSSLAGIGNASAIQLFELSLDMLTAYTPPKIIVLANDNTGAASYVGGMEFSPDGRYLYFTNNTNLVNPSELYYYDRLTDVTSPLGVSTALPIERGNIGTDVNGHLYFASPDGLYRLTNPNNPNAANFSSSPVIPTTIQGNYLTLDVGYQLNSLLSYTIPNQIDNQNYEDFFTQGIACCVDNRTYHTSTYIAGSGTWNGNSNLVNPGVSTIYVQKELRIPAGVNLNIHNMVFKFAPGARLVIENGTGSLRGGRLQLYNTTLTVDDRCSTEEMWLGVEVWGNSTNVQGATFANSTQGVLRTFNSSKIEHALIGVLVSKRNESNGVPIPTDSYNSNHNGGIAIIENSEFFNCWGGLVFQPYNIGTNNLSRVVSTNFVWDGLLKNPLLTPQAHILINQCTDISIGRSNFYQHTPHLYSDPIDRGYGIFAFSSTFNVYSGCNAVLPIGHDCPDANNLPSKFENLYIGVLVWSFNSKPFTVLRNEFTNCLSGVTSIGAKNQDISRNKFYIPESDTIQTFGIYVTSGTGYRIAENYLKGYDNPSISLGDARTYGIIIDNSGAAHNEVYKNTFEELYVGTQAQGNNAKIFVPGSNDNGGGLRYHCNEFKQPIHLADIGVNGRIDYEHGRIGGLTEYEARNINTARNKFSMFGENHSLYPDHDIMLYPGSQQINYVHLADDAHTPDNYTINSPTAVYPSVQYWGGTTLSADTFTCPTKFPAIPPFIIDTFAFDGMITQINDLEQRIDAGKTDKLLNLIASQPNGINTYEELMAASPYLSDKVLESYIYSAVSDNRLKDVLVANSGLSNNIRNILDSSKRPELKKDMSLYQSRASSQQLLTNQIKSANERLNNFQRDIISAIVSDTTITSDNLVRFLEACQGVDFKKSLLSQYSTRQEKSKFDELLGNLSEHLSEEHSELYRVQYLIDGYASIQEAVGQNSSILMSLEQIVKTGKNEEAVYIAESIISVLNGENVKFRVLPLVPSRKNPQVYQDGKPEQELTQQLSSIKLFPNPSKGTVEFHFSELESATVTVQLVDLTGKEVFSSQFTNTARQQIDFSHLKKGTYLVKVVVDDQQFNAQLLILE